MNREPEMAPPPHKRKLLWTISLAGLALLMLFALAAFFRWSGWW